MGAFRDFFSNLLPVRSFWTDMILSQIEGAQSVESLDKFWSGLDAEYTADQKLSSAYTDRKTELTAAGQIVPKNRILGFIGVQVANAIWAVTEHALPLIMTAFNTSKDAYTDRMEDLEAMDAKAQAGTLGAGGVIGTDDLQTLEGIAGAGEFGLNAVVNFLLHTTLYPSVYANARPFWEDWIQAGWAAHPSKIPSMSALVRMEYREVFRPEFRQELILDEPISADFETYAAKVGYSKTQAENYWGAHWDLPSRGQGYEMYHRLRPAISVGGFNIPASYSKPFELDDLNTLLKRQDVLHRYRDQLVEIAYKPFTRVDVRRMYRAGVLSFEEVIAAYLDAGYAPDKALKMAEFTRAWVTEGVEKRETKGAVLDAMKTGIISEAEAETELQAFYPDDVAKRSVETAIIKNQLNQSDVGWLLKAGEMDASEAETRFGEMGYPADDVAYLLIRYAPPEE